MDDAAAIRAAGAVGTPCYLLDGDAVAARVAETRAALGGRLALSFAVKANPNPSLLAFLRDQVDHLDVSSGGELDRALAAGWEAERITFTGPAKRDAEIEAAIVAGVGGLVIESVREAERTDALAARLRRRPAVLVRVSPDHVPRGFGDTMAGRPSAFGIDREDFAADLPRIAALPHLRIDGLHCYSGTQCLKPEAIAENWAVMAFTFAEAAAVLDLTAARLILGSGFGVPYHDGDPPLNLRHVAAVAEPVLAGIAAHPRLRDAALSIETGRYLVAEAGLFVTRVLATKTSRGHRIALCDGGLNANLAAAGMFGMLLRRPYRMRRLGSPAGAATEPCDIAGPLCTPLDRFGTQIALPPLAEGDLLAIEGCGAYGASASPTAFISHPAPRDGWMRGGELRDVSG